MSPVCSQIPWSSVCSQIPWMFQDPGSPGCFRTPPIPCVFQDLLLPSRRPRRWGYRGMARCSARRHPLQSKGRGSRVRRWGGHPGSAHPSGLRRAPEGCGRAGRGAGVLGRRRPEHSLKKSRYSGLWGPARSSTPYPDIAAHAPALAAAAGGWEDTAQAPRARVPGPPPAPRGASRKGAGWLGMVLTDMEWPGPARNGSYRRGMALLATAAQHGLAWTGTAWS